MKKMLPQEVEVWYLIPSLRKEFSKIFIEKHGLSQKETAKILGITEAAVSQYLSKKRASQSNFSKSEMSIIEKSAEKIIRNPKDFMKILYQLCVYLRKTKVICKVHKNQDKNVSKDCNICFEK